MNHPKPNLNCDYCGGCAGVCPENAITVFETSIVIDKALCNNCSNCIKMCPAGAMKGMFKNIKMKVNAENPKS